MSQTPSSSSFQALFDAALKDYENQTGIDIVNHPITKQLEECDSLDSITVVLREQAKCLREFRRDNGKLMKSLMCSIDVLYTISTVLGEGIGIPFPPTKAIFAGIAILLGQAVKITRASYGTLVELFTSFENFLGRLRIYAGISLTPALSDILVKIIAELLRVLALTTKHVKRGRFKKFVKSVWGGNEIEAALRKLDRLTSDECRATAAQTLEVAYGLSQHSRKVVLDDADVNNSSASISRALECTQKIVTRSDSDLRVTREKDSEQRSKLQQHARQCLEVMNYLFIILSQTLKRV